MAAWLFAGRGTTFALSDVHKQMDLLNRLIYFNIGLVEL